MEKKNYQVWKYEKMLWGKAIKDTVALYRTDWRTWLGNLVSIAFTLFALRVLGGPQVMSDQLTSILAGIIGAVGGTIFILLVHRMSAPLILYREKETEANKRSWKDIEIKPYHFPENSGFGVGLEILSDKPREFRANQVFCQITEIKRGWDVIFRGNMQIPLLYVPSLERRQEIINRKDFNKFVSTEAIAIAHHDRNQAWIQKNDALQDVIIEKNITHTVIIAMNGMINDNLQMDGCTVFCELLYNENKKGQMEISLKIIERVPSHEV